MTAKAPSWRRSILLAALVGAALAPGLVGSGSAGGQAGWDGFSVSNLPSAIQTSPGWGLAVTSDLGGGGVDVWNNNHGFMSEAVIDIAGTATTRTAASYGSQITLGPDSHGAAFSDIDGDGDEDLLEVSGRNNPNRLFRNDGGTLVSVDAGNLEDILGRGRQPLFADFDGDGDMDVLIANLDLRSDPVPQNERQLVPSDVYLNNGNGRSWTVWPDPNEVITDGHVRMANLTSTGPGTPTIAVTHNVFVLGVDSVALGTNSLQEASNPAVRRTDTSLPIREVIVGDFDGDLYPEFVVFAANESQSAGNWPVTAYEVSNAGAARQVTIPRSADLDNCRSGAAADFDNDGDLDIIAGCSQLQEGQNRNVILLNDGSGNFRDAGTSALARTVAETATAIVTADVNADGWMDAIVANGYDFENAVDHVLTNDGGSAHWLGIDVVGSNPDGMGAQVFVGTDKWQVRETGHSAHRAQDSRTLHFGLGSATSVAPVHVRWPDGTYSACTVGGIDRVVRLVQGSAACSGESHAQMLAALDAAPQPSAQPPVDAPLTCLGEVVTVDMSKGQRPTAGDDVIRGTAGRDVINALGGNDIICALQGNDVIDGGNGMDLIYAGDGDDTINGGALADRIRGGPGNDSINGGGGWDWLFGNAGNDTINGGTGQDKIRGGLGVDRINGGGSFDYCNGGRRTNCETLF